MEVDLQNLREMLTAYAAELRNETPILVRYSNVIPRPDGLGGSADGEMDKAFREDMQYPSNSATVDSCIRALRLFKHTPTMWDRLRSELLNCGDNCIVSKLECLREKRNENIDDMIKAAQVLKEKMPSDYEILLSGLNEESQHTPKYDIETALKATSDKFESNHFLSLMKEDNSRSNVLDYRDWEMASEQFDRNMASAVSYIVDYAKLSFHQASTRQVCQ